MKKSLQIIFLLASALNLWIANTAYAASIKAEQAQVITRITQIERYIKKNGMQKALIKFKESKDIFIGDYNGLYFISPLHPELIGKSQLNYKDPAGSLVVLEEINKAKAGGGWLKGRWRYNSITKTYQCRKIYVLPVAQNYLIGSWYHYSAVQKGICLN